MKCRATNNLHWGHINIQGQYTLISCCIQKRRLEVAAAADARAEQVRAAHQAKLARAEQQAVLAQQRKLKQAAELKNRSLFVAARNQEVHQKRCAFGTYTKAS